MEYALVLVALCAQAAPPPLQELFQSPEREYCSVAVSPDGGWLAAGGSGFVRVISLGLQPKEHKVLSQYGRVDEAFFEGNGLFTRSRDQDVKVWDAETWAPLKFAVESGALGDLALAGGWVVLPGRGRGVELWSVAGLWRKPRSVTRWEVRECSGVAVQHVTAAAWAGTSLLLADEDGFLFHNPDLGRLISSPVDPRTGRAIVRTARSAAAARAFRPHEGEVYSLSVSADGKLCVTAGKDGKVKLWEVARIPPIGREPQKAPDPAWKVEGHLAEISPDGRLLAVANADGVGVYHAASGVAVSWNAVKQGRVVRLRFEREGRILAAVACRCAECGPGRPVTPIGRRTRLADHGGVLVVWK